MTIIPNWHPILVHFTVALLSVSSVLYAASYFIKPSTRQDRCLTVAEWNFWIGSVFTVLTLLAGWYAYNTVAHDTPSHNAMSHHRNWALATAALILALCVWLGLLKRSSKPISGLFVLAIMALFFLLMATAWHGGEIVYRHGLGVMSLPTVEDHGTEDGHQHTHDNDHNTDTIEVHESQNNNQENNAHQDEHSHDYGDRHFHRHADDQQVNDLDDLKNYREEVTKTVSAFHQAMKAGNTEKMRLLLDKKVLIFESGHVERSAEEYANKHMLADIEFMKNMSVTHLEQQINIRGELAVLSSRSRIQGRFKEKEIDYNSLESMVLIRHRDDWRIVHIHWSK